MPGLILARPQAATAPSGTGTVLDLRRSPATLQVELATWARLDGDEQHAYRITTILIAMCAEVEERRVWPMAKDSSPICFRVSDEERVMLVAAASYVGESLSAFMRQAAVETAQEVMNLGGGVDAVVANYREVQQRRVAFKDREQEFLAPGP